MITWRSAVVALEKAWSRSPPRRHWNRGQVRRRRRHGVGGASAARAALDAGELLGENSTLARGEPGVEAHGLTERVGPLPRSRWAPPAR